MDNARIVLKTRRNVTVGGATADRPKVVASVGQSHGETHRILEVMVTQRRFRVPGGCYFFTVALADPQSSLLTERISCLREAIRSVKHKHPFTIDAIVILPDHLHCIWTLPRKDDNFSIRWRQIKAAFSRELPNTEYRSQSRKRKNERGIWQRRFWEHAARDERDQRFHVDYTYHNPVKHGYVQNVVDWKHSSFHRFVTQGLYPSNWAGSGDNAEVSETGEVD